MNTLDLPPNVKDINRLVELINDRLRRVPAVGGGDLDMGGYRIVNLGDAVDQMDALNVRSGDRRYRSAMVPRTTETVIQAATTYKATY